MDVKQTNEMLREMIEEGRFVPSDAGRRANKLEKDLSGSEAKKLLQVSYDNAELINKLNVFQLMKDFESKKADLDSIVGNGYTDQVIGTLRALYDERSSFTIVQAALSRASRKR